MLSHTLAHTNIYTHSLTLCLSLTLRDTPFFSLLESTQSFGVFLGLLGKSKQDVFVCEYVS